MYDVCLRGMLFSLSVNLIILKVYMYVFRLVSLVTWHCFDIPSLREQEFENNKDLKKMWNVFAKKFKKAGMFFN